MAEKRRGLGRGLGALISSSPAAGAEEEASQRDDANGADARQEPATSSSQEKQQGGGKKQGTAAPQARPGKTAPKKSTPQKATAAPREASQAAAEAPQEAQGGGGPAKASKAPSGAADGQSPKSQSNGPGSTGKKAPDAGARAKSRPVDMFFTPGRAADVENSDAEAAVGENKTPSRNGKRPQMPDVIGQARVRTAPPATETRGAAVEAEDSSSEPAVDAEQTLVPVPGATFAELSVREIHPNRKQPRQVFDEEDMEELVHSIREIGLLQPIVVRPSTEVGDERYELVMGERRWRATQQAGLDTIPAIVRKTTDEDLLRDALLENLHRSELNPLEEAAAYQQLLDEFGCTQEELSARIGRSRPQISNTIRLMKLPALVQRRVAAGVISQGHARALLALTDPGEIERLAQRIVAEGLSVRATEEAVAMNEGVEKKRREAKPRNTARHERLDYLANSLSDRLDTNVKISLGAKKGRVAIEFASVDDLNRIMGLISPDGDK